MYPWAFHADTCAYGINPFVIGFYGNFGPFSGNPDNFLDRDQTIKDFRYFKFKQSFKKYRRSTAKNNERSVVSHFHGKNNCSYWIALTEMVWRDLLRFWRVWAHYRRRPEPGFPFPNLIDLSGYDLSNPVLIFYVYIVFSSSRIRAVRFCRSESIALLPKSRNFTSSETSSSNS